MITKLSLISIYIGFYRCTLYALDLRMNLKLFVFIFLNRLKCFCSLISVTYAEMQKIYNSIQMFAKCVEVPANTYCILLYSSNCWNIILVNKGYLQRKKSSFLYFCFDLRNTIESKFGSTNIRYKAYWNVRITCLATVTITTMVSLN